MQQLNNTKLAFEKRGVDYFLGEEQIVSVSTIIGSGGGGEASYNGSLTHEAAAIFFKTGSKEGFKDVNPEDFKIFQNLGKFLIKNNLKPKYVEYPFIAEIEGCKYAGTIDLVCEDKDSNLFVFDYKTGRTKDSKHSKQVSAYCLGIDARKGYVVYRDTDFIFSDYTQGDFEIYSEEFKDILFAYYGKLEGKTWRNGKIYNAATTLLGGLAERLKEIKTLKNELENEEEVLKEHFKIELDGSVEGYNDVNLLVSWVKPRINYTLKKEAKQKLLKETPDYFEFKEVDGYYNFKVLNKDD
ncbi:MAG: PD-(D/E)XK nuclease family protein [Defluviitaleaceae bacterium]|nr:PD-(D/E)XK nuclease family protein [Defluviitaleaceae bacterium]